MEYQKVDIANTSVTSIPVNVTNGNQATDVFIRAGTLAPGANVVIQPAGTEKIMVSVHSNNGAGAVQVEYTTDGVNFYGGCYATYGMSGVYLSGGVNAIAGNKITFYADNTQYFRIRNVAVGNIDYQVIGVKWV